MEQLPGRRARKQPELSQGEDGWARQPAGVSEEGGSRWGPGLRHRARMVEGRCALLAPAPSPCVSVFSCDGVPPSFSLEGDFKVLGM